MKTIYELPEWSFVGGESQLREFILYENPSTPCDIPGGSCNFSIMEYVNASDTPLLSKAAELGVSDEGQVNRVTVTIKPDETKQLSGRYEYQLTVKDRHGNVSIPKKGLMQIYRNINKQAIS